MSWDQVVGGAAHAALLGWLIALAILPTFALVAIALHHWHRAKLLEPDNPPLRDRESVQAVYAVRMVEGRRGHLPSSLTYSPHLRTESPVLDAESLPAANIPNLSLEDVLRGPGLTYGTDVLTGQMVTDDRVRSMLVGGVPGSGKSTFVTLLAVQLVHRRATVLLGDPHSGNRESLANRLHGLGVRLPTEDDPRRIRDLVENAAQEVQARKHCPVASTGSQPVVVVVDELPELIRLLGGRDRERLRTALELLGFSGRKFDVSALLMSQSWTRAVIGGTEVRNLVPAAAVFRMRRDEALAMSGIRAEGWRDDPLSLPPGEAYIVGVGSDISRIRVPSLGARPVLGLPSSVLADTPYEHTASTPRAQSEHPQRAQILELARRGMEPREIVKAVFGLQKTGATYTTRLREVWGVVTERLTE
jgi:hypothetical protein